MRHVEGSRGCAAKIALATAAVVLAAVAPACTRSAAPAAVPFAERLVVAELHVGDRLDTRLGEMVESEWQRLATVCPPADSHRNGCVERSVRPSRTRIANLVAEPGDAAMPVATVYARLRALPGDAIDLRVALDLEYVDAPDQFVTFIEDIGDWGYGIHIDGLARAQGTWVQLLPPLAKRSMWLPHESPQLSASVAPLAEEIVDLDALPATSPTGTRAPIQAGSYKILRIVSDQVEFREEIATDFACGDDVAPPAVMPLTLRAMAADFFAADGNPRFSTKYTKGC